MSMRARMQYIGTDSNGDVASEKIEIDWKCLTYENQIDCVVMLYAFSVGSHSLYNHHYNKS